MLKLLLTTAILLAAATGPAYRALAFSFRRFKRLLVFSR